MNKKKKAFVFDTNFIISYNKLKEVVDSLSEDYNVYVSEVSIKERTGQEFRKEKERVTKIVELLSKSFCLSNYDIDVTEEEIKNKIFILLTHSYNSTFGDRIIRIKDMKRIMESVLDRANFKIPPFSDNKNASDKGFKDAVLWETLLEFFKNEGEEEIMFLSNDDGFINNKDYLCNEFKEKTGKTIIIEKNSHYESLLQSELNDQPKEIDSIPKGLEREEIKKRINELLEKICVYEDYDAYSGLVEYSRFKIIRSLELSDVQLLFRKMSDFINEHVLENCISPELLFNLLDVKTYDIKSQINIELIRDLYNIYYYIWENYKDLITPFYNAISAKINYKCYVNTAIDEDDTPFY